MAVEEVVLSVVGHADRSEASGGSPVDGTGTLERLIRDYVDSARAQHRFAIGSWMRRRRRQRYDLALKTLVKTMASEASRNVPDRTARLGVRTQVYGSVMLLARTMASDHLIIVGRARNMLRWGLALAAIGTTGAIYTLIANDPAFAEWLRQTWGPTNP
jgi:hypothetical protein